MTSSPTYSPKRAAQRDLSARHTAWAAVAGMAVVVALDLRDGQLSLLYSVGFVLVVITAALAIESRSLFTAAVLPPLLLIGSLLAVSIVNGDAIVIDGLPADTGTIGRTLASVIDHGVTVVVGHGAAIVIVVMRLLKTPARP